MVAQLAEKAPVALFPRQTRFVEDTRHYPGYVGGIGSGKTFAGAIKAIMRMTQPGLGLVVSPTYDLLRLTTQLTLFDLLDRLGIPYQWNKGERILTIPSSGAVVAFRTGERPENLRGPNVRWAWIDETSLMQEELWKIVIGRARVGIDYQVWASFTPKGRNWCQRVWEVEASGDEGDPLRPLYRISSRENPELPEGWVDSLGYTGKFAEQELEGLFVAFEGAVYPHFDRQKHVFSLLDEKALAAWRANLQEMRAVMGVDVGTRNPTAILTARGEPEAYRIEREVYRAGLDSEQIVDEVEREWKRCRASKVYFDPSALAYIETCKRRGIPAEKANNEVVFGVQAVAAEIESGLLLDPSCVNTIAEAESYHYPDGKRKNDDKPAKEGDHAMDSLRYIIASEAMRKRPRIY